MAAPRPITIVGGGLAGLTLGIGLRQQRIPVSVWEAGHYPRHRVCGEFISGNGPAVLRRLGLYELFDKAGAIDVRSATFISGNNHSPVRKLPEPALGLSRYIMDAALAEKFLNLGGELHSGTRRQEKDFGDGVVRASGRRVQSTEGGWRWFGLKAHATNVNPAADLEMHVSADNYVGVNRINGGEVNVCGLFRAQTGKAQSVGFELLRGKPGSALRDQLASARFDESSFCSVAGLSLKPHRAAGTTECCIGDAVTMIPPVTGNGMSMAFESAELAIEPLRRYSLGETTWPETRQKIAQACDAAFARRLFWASWLQRLMFSPILRTPVAGILLGSNWLWELMFTKTR